MKDGTLKKHKRGISEIGVSSLRERGFTLIEMIVAVSLFTVVVMVAVGALLSIADANRKANAIRTVVDNLNFGMESITRNIRTGSGYACDGSGNCPSGGSSLTFTDQSGMEVTYAYDANAGQITVQEGVGDPLAITSPDVDIENLTFFVTGVGGSGENAGKQPRVVMVVKGRAGILPRTESPFFIQATISQRRLES